MDHRYEGYILEANRIHFYGSEIRRDILDMKVKYESLKKNID
jgi:hypothetical protein